MLNARCPDCNGTNLILIGKLSDINEFAGNLLPNYIKGGSLYLCSNCKLKFRYPVLNEADYNKLYDTENQNWIFDDNRNDWKILKKFVAEHIQPNGKILDFGCNLGDVLFRLPNNVEKYGIEINKQSADIAAKKINSTIWNGFDDLPANTEFDLIFAIDVIEHLESPKNFVIKALSYVKKGGYIALMTGDGNSFFWRLSGAKWYYSVFAEHIAFISKLWADNLAGSINNLEVLHCQNYIGTNRPILKRIKWFLVWVINFALRGKTKWLFNASSKITETGMGDMKHFGKNFSKDHLFLVFRKS
jgi:2-polyprenyl-3-methyl-5-hydroxy-6-metoxy-1,4-benzoquinol methylase